MPEHYKPQLGERVTYASHVGDGILSPAIVLRTRDTTKPEVAERYGVIGAEDEQGYQFDVDLGGDDNTVDLLVHGLMRDYRLFSVPFDAERGARTWSWRP
jgi:hypothetical protein